MADPTLQALFQKAMTAAKAVQQAELAAERSPTMTQRDQARQLLLQVLERDQGHIPAWLWLSTVVVDPEEKQLCLENVLVIDPENKAAHNGLAHLKQQAPPPSCQNEEPCPFCQQPVASFDTTCRHCQAPLIVSCPACERRVEVEAQYCPCGQFLGDCRDQVDYFATLAEAYERHKRLEKVLSTWKTVEHLQPDYPHILLKIGEAEAASGRTDAAISILQRAMKTPADKDSAALALGKILQKLQQWDEAARLFRQVVAEAPANPEAHFALGWLFMEQGQLRETVPYLEKTLDLNPQHGLAWLRMAQLQEHFQNDKRAGQAYQRANQFLPRDSLNRLHSQQKLKHLKPALPSNLASNWGELLRQVSGPILVCLLAALLDAGLRPWWIPLSGWFAILLSVVGSFLWVSGSSLPLNPLIELFLSKKAFASEDIRFTATALGLIFWFLALTILLWPIGQSFPEVPTL